MAGLLLFIALRILPIFLLIVVGFLAWKMKWIDHSFIAPANAVVYRLALPSLIFLSLAEAEFSRALPAREMIGFAAALAAATGTGYLVSKLLRLDSRTSASFVQGSLRGNFAILAFALIQQILGPGALQPAALMLAFMLPMQNLVGIAVLSDARSRAAKAAGLEGSGFSRTLLDTFANPIMISIYLGVLTAVTGIRLPEIAVETLTYLRRLTLPLALLGIGASLPLYHTGGKLPLAAGASAIKLILMPIAAVTVGALLGLPSDRIVMLAIYAGSPAAIATYPLADALGADRDLAGGIILVSHLACFFTIALLVAAVRIVAG